LITSSYSSSSALAAALSKFTMQTPKAIVSLTEVNLVRELYQGDEAEGMDGVKEALWGEWVYHESFIGCITCFAKKN
jgi:hypothetical protein